MTALPLEKQKEEIRSACIKANPEIETDWTATTVLGTSPEHYPARKGIVVKGRPIRLADVLLAIYKKAQTLAVGDVVMNDGQPAHAIHWRDEKWMDVLYKWNLYEDDLDKQRDVAVSLIHGLITTGV